jgi:hypothetical protein
VAPHIIITRSRLYQFVTSFFFVIFIFHIVVVFFFVVVLVLVLSSKSRVKFSAICGFHLIVK